MVVVTSNTINLISKDPQESLNNLSVYLLILKASKVFFKFQYWWKFKALKQGLKFYFDFELIDRIIPLKLSYA